MHTNYMKAKTEVAQRMSAEARREEILDAAIAEFATYGLHGTSTEAIARRAGISQPYIFRLFGTKKELFIATAERVCDRVLQVFQHAAESAEGSPREILDTMGQAYGTLLRDRDEFLVMLHAFAAAKDPEVQATVRRGFGEIYRFVERASGAGDEQVALFVAYGMLLTIGVALDLPALAETEEWARKALSL